MSTDCPASWCAVLFIAVTVIIISTNLNEETIRAYQHLLTTWLNLQDSWITNTHFTEEDFISPPKKINDFGMSDLNYWVDL